MKKLMLLAAMLAMVLAAAAPAMAQIGDVDAATQPVDNTTTAGDIDIDLEDTTLTECNAIVALGGDANAAAAVVQTNFASNVQANPAATQNSDDSAEVTQYCVDIVNSFNTTSGTKWFPGHFGLL